MDKRVVEDRIIEIRQRLTLYMNGVSVEDMRRHGIVYKLSYGVSLPELRSIASEYEKEHDLAQGLWRQECRECKMLAAMLQPYASFNSSMADFWLESIEYPDLAEVCCKYLFPYMPGASQTAFRWLAGFDNMAQYCGFLTIANLMREGREMADSYKREFRDQADAALKGDAMLPRQGAFAALNVFTEKYGDDRL